MKTYVGLISFFCMLTASFFSFSIAATPVDPKTVGKRVFSNPPKLLVVLPEEDSTIFGTELTVRLVVENLILTDWERRPKAEPGEGHIHVWLDDKDPIPASAHKSFAVDDALFTNVIPGDHELRVELVNNDDSSFTPPVVQTVRFTTVIKQKATDIPQPTTRPIEPLSYPWQSAYVMPAILGAIFLFLIGILLRRIS